MSQLKVGQKVRYLRGDSPILEKGQVLTVKYLVCGRVVVEEVKHQWPIDDFAPLDEFVKHDAGKPRPDLVPATALHEIWKVLEYGSRKYDDDNWRKTSSIRRYFSASLRHLWAWFSGEDLDPESGLHHLAHAGTCVLFMLALAIDHPDCDDRPRV